MQSNDFISSFFLEDKYYWHDSLLYSSVFNGMISITLIYLYLGSITARLCVEGMKATYSYCDTHNIPYKKVCSFGMLYLSGWVREIYLSNVANSDFLGKVGRWRYQFEWSVKVSGCVDCQRMFYQSKGYHAWINGSYIKIVELFMV